MELAEGVVLDGQYRLRLRLGRSELGEVWEAGHTRAPKLLAIKFLRTVHAPERQAAFRREAAIAARLRHPSIVEVTGFNVLADGTAYLVMERLFGEDLRARLGRGALPLAEAREITRQVASALWFAHQQGIVHRELKPENVFLSRESDGALRVKVLDFGISKPRRVQDEGAPHAPSYLAPEQVLGRQAEIDARSDVFALAAIVFEMLTGQGAFVGETHAALRAQVLQHVPPPLDVSLPAVPRAVAVAVSIALAKDPAARHGDVRAFSDAVVGAGTRPRPSAPPPASEALGPPPIDVVDVLTRSERPQPASPSQPARHRLRYAFAAALLVAGAVAASAWWQLRRPPAVSSTPLATAPTPPPQVAEAKPPAVVTSPPERAVPAVVGETRPPGELDPGALTRAQPSLSSSSRAALAAAERALEDGASAEALRLASEALHEGAREPAYALMARAYCALRDAGMVQAMLRNLSPALRAQVRAQCVQRGLSLP